MRSAGRLHPGWKVSHALGYRDQYRTHEAPWGSTVARVKKVHEGYGWVVYDTYMGGTEVYVTHTGRARTEREARREADQAVQTDMNEVFRRGPRTYHGEVEP